MFYTTLPYAGEKVTVYEVFGRSRKFSHSEFPALTLHQCYIMRILFTQTCYLHKFEKKNKIMLSSVIFNFSYQAGFILMETGSLSTKRRVNALILKNLGDTILCAFFYFLIGYYAAKFQPIIF